MIGFLSSGAPRPFAKNVAAFGEGLRVAGFIEGESATIDYRWAEGHFAFCWAHLRRKFYDIAKDDHAPVATEALERIAKLYLIEKTISGPRADERRTVRQERSKPLVFLRIVFGSTP